ncbi:MAG: inorganic diphosphatase [Thermoprotei archaeon]|nr:MAG: inorganic diphosphatase [Thermoprotei archaeon]RLF17936.1 MAG: inorganic diphosphatase [Thermoprotei archaeon]
MLKKLPPGKNPPDDIYVIIEIPKGSNVKYELDEETGAIFVDRVLYTAMFYPFNYGIVPQTLMPDGDPVDVLVISNEPFAPGTIVRVRPIGVLEMEDEEGIDHKIIAVPIDKVDPRFSNIKDVKDLPEAILNQIRHFFEHYKELEPGKWTKVRDFHSANKAKEMITKAIEEYKRKESSNA